MARESLQDLEESRAGDFSKSMCHSAIARAIWTQDKNLTNGLLERSAFARQFVYIGDHVLKVYNFSIFTEEVDKHRTQNIDTEITAGW